MMSPTNSLAPTSPSTHGDSVSRTKSSPELGARVRVPHRLAPMKPVSGVDVRSFPRDDDEFRADVDVAIAAARGPVRALVDGVQAELRERYPHVALHAQNALAMVPGQPPAIYAYRDGGIVGAAMTSPAAPAGTDDIAASRRWYGSGGGEVDWALASMTPAARPPMLSQEMHTFIPHKELVP